MLKTFVFYRENEQDELERQFYESQISAPYSDYTIGHAKYKTLVSGQSMGYSNGGSTLNSKVRFYGDQGMIYPSWAKNAYPLWFIDMGAYQSA